MNKAHWSYHFLILRRFTVGLINQLCDEANLNSRDKGFWNDYDIHTTNTKLVKLALIMSELGEAVEAARSGDMFNFEEELADVCIRTFDLCGEAGINLELAILKKMDFNKSRPFLHNKLA